MAAEGLGFSRKYVMLPVSRTNSEEGDAGNIDRLEEGLAEERVVQCRVVGAFMRGTPSARLTVYKGERANL